MSPKECDIIFGSDCFFDCFRSGKIVGSKNETIAQRTMFGWVVAGKLNVKNKEPHELYSHFLSTENELNTDQLLQRFWETAELSVKKQFLSDEEQFCENYFKSNFKYNDEGRFVVKLPIYRDTSRLGNSKGIAISRLLAMERRFQVDMDFERHYKNFMIEYESLGHMIPVENNVKSMDSKIYFLPHHAVMKGDGVSTKLRVVFDDTCKPSNGNSLNSILGIGKMLQPDLFTILVKFSLNEITFSADFQQMYRQILIDQEDQNFQRIVWRESKDSPIREYKLCTVTYGTSSAPYLATRCLFQIGLDLERDDPAVSSLIKESFYIDDLMAGAPLKVLSHTSSNWVEDSSNLEIHPDECSRALGLTWNSMNDIFIFNLKVNFPDNITKCSFLSQSARLFNPLGFLTPCTVSIKTFYQQLWLLKLDWDSPLPEALATKWKTIQNEFEQVCSIHIPRWIHTASQQITLHGFCDASELAYASVTYDVQPQTDELNGALLLARLYATCKNILKEYDVHFYAWTEYQVVLSWLSSHPRNWKPYIANRTSEILDLVPADSWRYVPTKMNPADIACRGLSPKELLTCVLWYRATTSKQLMGDLPTHRVTPSRPFSVCGVDYAGPITILRYRALHLELVSDLTSEAFSASLKCFCARRGALKHIYCDNDTTFVGARRKLQEIFKFVSKLNENEHFCYFLSKVNIEWHFSPPVSPHFGGLWEAGVKSIK
ncbi:DUF1758 domain-containing protein [Trichonephila clavipes]|nr:DUF1758 domain-containing protein [Trichonephila clavipes]